MKRAAGENEDAGIRTNIRVIAAKIDNNVAYGYTHGYGICPQNELLFAAKFRWRNGES
jgi:hypothetical protein